MSGLTIGRLAISQIPCRASISCAIGSLGIVVLFVHLTSVHLDCSLI